MNDVKKGKDIDKENQMHCYCQLNIVLNTMLNTVHCWTVFSSVFDLAIKKKEWNVK